MNNGQYQNHGQYHGQGAHSPGANMGASYYPGGNDDFYIPVVSPLPQRSMPEVPGQIDQSLAQLELGDRSSSTVSGIQSPPMGSSGFQEQHYGGPHGASQYAGSYGSNQNPPPPQNYDDEPSFSPFPVLRNRARNVPQTTEETENTLETAREGVLNSGDPEMQLTWAQDTLAYVDIALQNELRLSETRPARAHTPQIEHGLRVDAVNIVTFLADQAHPRAQFQRGMWLEFGKFGFGMDKREAYRCYSKSAQAGYARAEYRMGMQFESSSEIPKAIKHYNIGMEHGDAASNYRMGMIALLGQHGQPQDMQRGLELIRFSADNADENAPQGAYVYGMLCAGELPQITIPEHILARDLDAARFHIEKAAYLGFGKALVKMGAAYELSQLNCSFDPVLSLHYNNLAARQGEPEAEMAISKWFLSGYEGVFSKNEMMAFTYAQRAASSGLPTAEFAMGYFYEIGIHIPVSLKEANIWYGKAADHGNQDAAGRLEGIKRSKTLSRKDHDKIAVAKIKNARSQHGNRPERFSVQQELQPAQVTMPEFPQHTYNTPNAAPYPDHNSSYSSYNVPPQQQSQQSYAQYAPSPGLNPAPPPLISNFSSPDLSQNHSFTPGPMDRPHSAAPIGFANQGYGPSPSPRPGPGHPPQNYRVSTGGLPSGPAQGRPGYAPSPGPANKPLPPRIPDIGFSAPPDPTGADRVKQARRNDLPPQSRPQPGRGGYDARPERISSRPGGSPAPGPGGYPSHQSSSTPRPPRGESLPSQPRPSGPTSQAHKPMPPTAATGKPASSAPASAPGKKPGKGPSTFEQMGVPAAKKDDDCIIM